MRIKTKVGKDLSRMNKKRKLDQQQNGHQRRKLLNNAPKTVQSTTDFEAFGPSQPIPQGHAPLVFDAQLPGLPTRPDPTPLLDKIREERKVEFCFTRWLIVEEEQVSRFNSEHRLCLVGSAGDNTVSAIIDGVYPYLYVKIPENTRLGPHNARAFMRDCEYKLKDFMRKKAKVRDDDNAEAAAKKHLLQQEMVDMVPISNNDPFYVLDVQYVEKLPVKGFTTQTMPMFKIVCRNDKIRRKLARLLSQGIKPSCLVTQEDKRKLESRVDQELARERELRSELINAYGKDELDNEQGGMTQGRSRSDIYRKEYGKMINKMRSVKFSCFEADLDFGVQLNTDLDLRVNLWVSFEYPLVVPFDSDARWTDYQVEVHAHVDDLVVHEPEGKYEEFGKIYQLSFDGEMRAMAPGFPDASISPIIDMGLSLRTEITGKAYDYTGTLVQGPVGAMQDDKETASFTYESGLLIGFIHALSVHGISADLWTGWNIAKFDLPYVVDRLKLNFATENERILLYLRHKKKTDAFYRKLAKIASDNGYESVAELLVSRDANWIVNRLFPFPKAIKGDSAHANRARVHRMKTQRKDNFGCIAGLVEHIKTSRCSRQTLANIGIMPPPTTPSGDHDNEVFYHDLLCSLFPNWEELLDAHGAFYALMSILSPFRKGMCTFRCNNANNGVRDAYHVNGNTTTSCGNDSVYDASRSYQAFRSFKSRAHGYMESEPILAPTIMLFDMLPMFRKEEKRRSYALKTVFEDVMKVKTAEIDYALIPPVPPRRAQLDVSRCVSGRVQRRRYYLGQLLR